MILDILNHSLIYPEPWVFRDRCHGCMAQSGVSGQKGRGSGGGGTAAAGGKNIRNRKCTALSCVAPQTGYNRTTIAHVKIHLVVDYMYDMSVFMSTGIIRCETCVDPDCPHAYSVFDHQVDGPCLVHAARRRLDG